MIKKIEDRGELVPGLMIALVAKEHIGRGPYLNSVAVTMADSELATVSSSIFMLLRVGV